MKLKTLEAYLKDSFGCRMCDKLQYPADKLYCPCVDRFIDEEDTQLKCAGNLFALSFYRMSVEYSTIDAILADISDSNYTDETNVNAEREGEECKE